MLQKNTKKRTGGGFTLVELVIVIAVIAILAAVLIPTFITVTKKAKMSADTQIAKSMNIALASMEATDGKNATFTDALADIEENGYIVEKLTPTSTDCYLCWDQTADRIVYIGSDKESVVYSEGTADKNNLWMIVHNQTEFDAVKAKFSIYLADNYSTNGTIAATRGLDVGTHEDVTTITYERTGAALSVLIRTNGGKLNVNAPNDTVKHYGYAEVVNIIAVASTSYDEYGTVPFIGVKKGHVSLESGSDVNTIYLEKKDNTSFDEIKISVESTAETPKFSRDTVGTTLSNAVLVCEVDTAGSSQFIWIEGNGTIEDNKVSVSTTKDGTKTPVTESTASDAAKQIANTKDGDNVVDAGVTAETAQTTSALKGLGTEADPFIVYDAETMQKISSYYDVGSYYFKVKDGITEIDCSNWSAIDINGSFDGNGTKIINLSSFLFYYTYNSNIKNFDVINARVTGKSFAAIISSSALNSNYSNINIVGGYVEGANNAGSFIGLGWGVENNIIFTNCTSNATIVSLAGSVSAFVGHGYAGGASVLITLKDSKFTGKLTCTSSNAANFGYIQGNSDSNVKCFIDNTVGFNDAVLYTGYSNSECVANKVYYSNPNCTSTLTKETVTVKPEKYNVFTVQKVGTASYAVAQLIIAPNDKNNSGSYAGIYDSEDILSATDGYFVTVNIKNIDVAINPSGVTTSGYSNDGHTYNVVNSFYGKTHNGVSVLITQYDTNNNVIKISVFNIVATNV